MANQSYADYTTNSANPFYLHPNENPSLVLVSPLLTDKNYHTWARSMQIALISKNKEKFIDGTFPKPPVSDPLYSPWIRCNTMVLAWIQRSISEQIAKSVLWIDNASGVWKNLQIRFSQGDIFRISDIQEDLYKFKQGTLDVSNYFTQLKVMWDELENYRPIPSCSCDIACSCGAIASIRLYREQDYVIRFLKGLTEKFAHSKSQMMMMHPLPSIDKAFSLVIQQEREIDSSVSSVIPSIAANEQATALQTQTHEANFTAKQGGFHNYRGKPQASQGSNTPRGTNRVCVHCGRTNHTIETCFLKHGYPPGYNSYKGKSKSQGGAHTNSSAANVSNGSNGTEFSSQGSATSSFGFTKEQYDSILALLQHSKQPSTVNSVSTSPLAMQSTSSNVNGKHSDLWILDTGATDHFSFNFASFTDHKYIVPIPVNLPNGSQIFASISGTVAISPSFILKNVLYVPSFHVNLISVAKLVEHNQFTVQFTHNSCTIMQNHSKEMIGIAKLHRGLYTLDSTDFNSFVNNSSISHNSSCNLWHMRLGHISKIGLHSIAKAFPFIICNNDNVPCDSCQFAKQKKLPFPQSISNSTVPFNILHADLWGPFSTVSALGHKYFLTLVDDFTRHTWVIFLKSKDQTKSSLINFVAYIENQFQTTLKCLRSDNGTEFVVLSDFFLAKGILHQRTCVETPQQNGVVERKHQHILNVARSIFFHSNVPLNMWNFCIQHAVHLINRLPTPLLKFKCPYEVLFKQPPSMMHLKVFGCLSYATSLQAHRTKFNPRARKAIFLGYKEGTKGYILYDLANHNFFISRNVVFYENVFPYKLASPGHNQSEPFNHIPSFPILDDPLPTSFPTSQPSTTDISFSSDRSTSDLISQPINSESATLHNIQPVSPPSTSPIFNQSVSSDGTPHTNSDSILNTIPLHSSPPNSHGPPESPNSHSEHELSSSNNHSEVPPSNNISTRHSSRQSNPPHYLKDYHCYSTLSNNTSHNLYPLSSVLSYDKCSPSYKHFCCNVSSKSEPKTFAQAIKLECWKQAMNAELLALEQNHTWTVVDLPHGKTPIGCRWVYKIKYKADGTIERYKARLVAKGYTQMEGIDFFDTFSPVAKITTVRVLLTIAAIKGWHVEQLDVNNAFLHGDLQEEVYMTLPPGISSSNPSQVCRLQKSLYGLKQASRQWYSKLSSFLLSLGYVQSQADHSLYAKSENSHFTTILVYVDDIVVAGNSLMEIHNVKALLDKQFKIKDLGNLRYFLGFEIARSTKGIFMNQRKYTLELLEDTGFLAAKPSAIPIDPTLKLTPEDSDLLADPTVYRRLIGRLIYLTNTRSDISYVVQHLSQFVSKPCTSHYQAALKILKFLKSSPATGILFSASSSLTLCAFADSDWARCPTSRKSVTGFCVLLGSSLICWKSKKQNTVSRSSTEAEYRALASLTCELQWLQFLLQDLMIFLPQPASVYCDSKSAIYLAHNPAFHERSKHIELDCHVVREKINSKLIHLLPISTKDQLADAFTKPLHYPIFSSIMFKLGLCSLHSPT